MDLEEWEFLPDNGYLDFHEDGEKKIFLGKRSSDPKTVFHMDYFICPSPPSPRKIIEAPKISRVPTQLVTVPFHLEPPRDKAQDDELGKEFTKVPIEISVVSSAIEADQDTVSQVFFKKMKENEFVDMKMDSPRSGTRGVLPQIDAAAFQFEDKVEALESKTSPRMKVEKDFDAKEEEEVTWEETNDDAGLNIWKWSSTGIGAICSFGVAAATICILFFGSNQRSKQNQKLRFQIYTDDKRIKQVMQNATRLNEAISAVRGVPMTRAHITYGGYYEGL